MLTFPCIYRYCFRFFHFFFIFFVLTYGSRLILVNVNDMCVSLYACVVKNDNHLANERQKMKMFIVFAFKIHFLYAYTQTHEANIHPQKNYM